MATQADLFTDTHPDARWISDCVTIIQALAATRSDLTSNDVWDRLTVDPTEKRAMGAAFTRAKRMGLIRNSGHYVPLGSNGRPIPVWKSLVVREAA